MNDVEVKKADMEFYLICGNCKKRTDNPKLSKNGKKTKCSHCGKWQTFKGEMRLV